MSAPRGREAMGGTDASDSDVTCVSLPSEWMSVVDWTDSEARVRSARDAMQ
jgi:hypothetical protein